MKQTAIIQLMKEMVPKTLPTEELSPFEQGVLAGQQLMLNKVLSFIEHQEPSKNTEDK